MRSLVAPFISSTIHVNDISAIRMELDRIPPEKIECFPWKEYIADTTVNFSIAHSATHVFLKFSVKEREVRMVNTTINSPVYEDSCVEFFISLDGTGYYNFEFNCIGTKLAEFGKSRNDRKFLPVSAIEKIKVESAIKLDDNNFFLWDLTLAIPLETFVEHQVNDLSKHQCRANFYKCGDKLQIPHYLTWSPVKTEEPDFHQPLYFGEVMFAPFSSTSPVK